MIKNLNLTVSKKKEYKKNNLRENSAMEKLKEMSKFLGPDLVLR